LQGPCTTPIRLGHPRPIVRARGVVNANGHGAWVFTYDQMIPKGCWDEYTVICRGLLVIFPRQALLAERVSEDDLSPGAKLDSDGNALLHKLCTSASCHTCRMFEPMAKFWEGGNEGGELSWEDVLVACGDSVPRLVRVEEKVDGNLGLLYPQLDEVLRPIAGSAPLLATKGIAHSPDIERQMQMLRNLHPSLMLPAGVSHAIIEVVDVEMKVCVPYRDSDMGARLIAASSGSGWLPQRDLDALASAWSMPRPVAGPCPEDGTLKDVQRMASEYSLRPGELLDEGFVAHFECLPSAELIRLKVHTHVWNVVHGWWENNANSKSRITIPSVMPILCDSRFALAGAEAFEPSLVKYHRKATGTEVNEQLVTLFRQTVERAKVCLEDCLALLGSAIKYTAGIPKGKALAQALDSLQDVDTQRSKQQLQCLKMFVFCFRSNFEAQMEEAQVAVVPGIVRRVYGAVDRDTEVGSSNLEPITPQSDGLVSVLDSEIMRTNFCKLLGVLGDEAEAKWKKEKQVDDLPPGNPAVEVGGRHKDGDLAEEKRCGRAKEKSSTARVIGKDLA